MNSQEFARLFDEVVRLKGWSQIDIDDAKKQVRQCWSDDHHRELWKNWIKSEYEALK